LTIDAPNLVTLTACRPSKSDAIVLNKPRKSFAEATKILVSDNEMQLQDFAEIDYPVAWEARIQGVVVVEAKLDEKGSVSDASALFGNPILIPDCLANVKKWSFSPNAKHLAVVVYRFKMPCACLNNAPEGQHQFILQPPNYVEVSHAPMWIQ
jgi:outer membrane biosynthesis protein TonB